MRVFLRAVVVLACLACASMAHALDKVVLQLKWKHQFQFAGYYAAVAKGYYRDAGLDVELREAVPGHDPLDEVLHGRAQYGVGTSNVILARARGEPVVLLAVIYQHSPFVLLASEASGVKDIHDLAERPIMMEPDAAELLAYFQSEGVDPSKLKLLPHSFDVHDLINGKAAAMSAYATDEPYHMKVADQPYLVFTPRAGGIDFYGDNLFTMQSELDAHPERVRKFLEASLKGWEYAMAHSGEIVDLILRDYNRGKTREQLLFEAEETKKLVHPELIELGYINPGRWRDISHTYESLGMLPESFSLKGFLYDRSPFRELRWLYWLGGAVLLAALGSAIWAIFISVLNRRLKHEVRAREQAEAQARAESAAKTHFYAILAHEVRTPLSGILSSLWLYQEAGTEAEKDELAGISQASARHLLELVDRVLDHSKIESGAIEVEAIPVNVREIVHEIIGLFQAPAIAKGLTVTEQVSPSVPSLVMSDPVRLRQILVNLFSNAVKFTMEGRVSLSVDAGEATEGVRLTFTVKDTGAGLTPEQVERIFKPYAQADSAVTRHHGGTGLGLSIAVHLSALMGGEIRVESEPGRGSTFTATILAGIAKQKA